VRRFFLVVIFALLLAAPAQAGGPSMLVGANEGLMLRTNLVETKANMALAKLAGFRAVNLHAFWWPEVTEPREYDEKTLGNVAAASRLLGVPVFVAVTNTRGRYTPVDDEQRESIPVPHRGSQAGDVLRVSGERREDLAG
jgi:hypothetical protein